MFCPNCGVKNSLQQNYCRQCGLKLETIIEAISEQFPSTEYQKFQRRKENLERIGVGCLTIAGTVGFSLLLFQAAQFKLELLGPNVLFWSAIGAVIGFLLLSVLFFNYAKLFMKPRKLTSDEHPFQAGAKAKLIEDRHFEPASVTEDTTRILKTPTRTPE